MSKSFHIEVVPTRHTVENIFEKLDKFKEKYNKVIDGGYCACLTDNAMGNISFQGCELISELGLDVKPEQLMIHLNTYHSKKELDSILDACREMGINKLLLVTGDGNERLQRLEPADIGEKDSLVTTSVELMRYVKKTYPDISFGCAFNPYEPLESELNKMKRKIDAGASFAITQPILKKNEAVDILLREFPDFPVTIGVWMSKRVEKLSLMTGTYMDEPSEYDPIETLKILQKDYDGCEFYLSGVGFRKQFSVIQELF